VAYSYRLKVRNLSRVGYALPWVALNNQRVWEGDMRTFRLTKVGKKKVRIPSPEREPILDHLYEFKTGTEAELLAVDGDGKRKIKKFLGKDHYIEELNPNFM